MDIETRFVSRFIINEMDLLYERSKISIMLENNCLLYTIKYHSLFCKKRFWICRITVKVCVVCVDILGSTLHNFKVLQDTLSCWLVPPPLHVDVVL